MSAGSDVVCLSRCIGSNWLQSIFEPLYRVSRYSRNRYAGTTIVPYQVFIVNRISAARSTLGRRQLGCVPDTALGLVEGYSLLVWARLPIPFHIPSSSY